MQTYPDKKRHFVMTIKNPRTGQQRSVAEGRLKVPALGGMRGMMGGSRLFETRFSMKPRTQPPSTIVINTRIRPTPVTPALMR